MATAQEKFDAASSEALCAMLSSVGAGAASYAAWGLLTPGPFDEWVALGTAGVAGLAYSYGCQWDSVNNTGTPTNWTPGCQKYTEGGVLVSQVKATGATTVHTSNNCAQILSVYDHETTGNSTCEWLHVNGGEVGSSADLPSAEVNWFIQLPDGATCDIPVQPHPVEPPAPYTYTDPDDGCELTVNFQGFAVDGGGNPGPVWKIEPVQQIRNSGGIIGGCNFEPVIYYQPPGGGGGGGGGGGPYAPWNPGPSGDGGEPWWMDVIRGIGQGAAAAATSALLDRLLQQNVGGKVYRIVSVCETDSQGEPVSESVEVDIPDLPWEQAVIYRLDALEHIMQGLKDFRQPICRGPRTVGELVTVHFQSDEVSPNGDKRLRKYLRYRDQLNTDLAGHTAHWEDFTWSAGPVMVVHTGADWGYLQVWAETADEGKRVIRHAGDIAGISPDTEGRWLISASSDPRYGQPGTMRLARRQSAEGEFLRISKRPSPNGLPTVPFDS